MLNKDDKAQAMKTFLFEFFYHLFFYSLALFVILVVIAGLTGCADSEVVTIQDCSVQQHDDEIVIECPDGSRAIIIEDRSRPPFDIKDKCMKGHKRHHDT